MCGLLPVLIVVFYLFFPLSVVPTRGRKCCVFFLLFYVSVWAFMASNIPITNSTLEEDILELSINDPLSPTFNADTLIGQLIFDKVVPFKVIKAVLLNVLDFGTKI